MSSELMGRRFRGFLQLSFDDLYHSYRWIFTEVSGDEALHGAKLESRNVGAFSSTSTPTSLLWGSPENENPVNRVETLEILSSLARSIATARRNRQVRKRMADVGKSRLISTPAPRSARSSWNEFGKKKCFY